MPTFHIENFGCRATQADGAALERQFASHGLAAASAADADLVVLNTCTVTNSADQDARAAIRRVQRRNPNAKIIVTGCYAQRAPEEIAALPGVSAVIGNSHKHKLADLVLPLTRHVEGRDQQSRARADTEREGRDPESQARADHYREGHDFSRADEATQSTAASAAEVGVGVAQRFSAAKSGALEGALAPEVDGQHASQPLIPISALTENRELRTENWIHVSDIFAHTELLAAPVFESQDLTENARTRPNLKVQDGCDNRCSFCVIPSVRGHSRSLPLPKIIEEVNALVAAGYKELVISGINLGRWGRDLELGNLQGFEGLLQAILERTSLEKLRISSVEPMDWSDELIALVANSPRIAKHAHVPLQSGSDAVLRRMHRKYRPWHYREKIEKIHAAMPEAAIGADVMTGFPGETDSDFESTRRLIAELPFTYLHVFTYSARPGTPAATMPNQVPSQVARDRNRILRDLATEKKHAFMLSFVGKQLPAITLNTAHHSAEGDITEALTDNYQKLFMRGCHEPNRWMTVQIEDLVEGTFLGQSAENRCDPQCPPW